MTAEDLARQVAKDLAPRLGPDLPARTEAVLQGSSPTRGWENLEHAIALSSFIVHTAGLAWDIYKHRQDLKQVRETLLAKAERPSGVEKAEAEQVVDAVIAQLSAGGTA